MVVAKLCLKMLHGTLCKIVVHTTRYSTTTFPVRQENGGAKKLGGARKVILTSLCDLTIQLALVLLAVFCTSVDSNLEEIDQQFFAKLITKIPHFVYELESGM